MDWTRQKLQMTRVIFISNDQYDLEYGHFDLEVDRMESILQVRRMDTGPRRGHETNLNDFCHGYKSRYRHTHTHTETDRKRDKAIFRTARRR